MLVTVIRFLTAYTLRRWVSRRAWSIWVSFTYRVYQRLRFRVARRRDPDLIVRRGSDNLPYLRRWHLIQRNRFLNVYLHCFERSDRSVPHDHPWWSLSWCLRGYLFERVGVSPNIKTRFVEIGNVRLRRPSTPHQIIVPDSLIGKSGVWTLFITGPRIREWGFHCPNGWRVWKDFVSAEDLGAEGAGCA